jgi:hypothetical protein
MRGCGTVFKDEATGGLAGAIQESYKKWDRKPSDFYPTPFDVTESLMRVIATMLEPGAATKLLPPISATRGRASAASTSCMTTWKRLTAGFPIPI